MAMRRQRRGRASSEWWEERVQRRRGIPGILVGVWGVGDKDREAWGGGDGAEGRLWGEGRG